MKAMLLLTALFLAPVLSNGAESNFPASDYFDAVVPEINRPADWPNRAEIVEDFENPVDVMNILRGSGVWRLGHTCSGYPIPMDRFLGKSLDAGQSARRPMMGMVVDNAGTISFIRLGHFRQTAQTRNTDRKIHFQCQLQVQPASEGFVLLLCSDLDGYQPIHLKPVSVVKSDGSRETILRTAELLNFTGSICPSGTKLFGVYSQVPTS